MKCLMAVIVFVSCSAKPDVIPAAKMENLMWDFIRADVYVSEFVGKDSSGKKAEYARAIKNILTRHGVTKDDFYRSYDYYKSRPNLLNPILDSIIAVKGKPQFNLKKNKKRDEKSLP